MIPEVRRPTYAPNTDDRVWWCNAHQRQATWRVSNYDWSTACCDPGLGGIMIPCECVDLTDLVAAFKGVLINDDN